MANDKPMGCARPTGGLVGEPAPETSEPILREEQRGAPSMIQVGKKAPDFGAPAYFDGDFTSVKLSDFLGKWVVLCFYPGDFTFV